MPYLASMVTTETFVIKKYRILMEFGYKSENIRAIGRLEIWRPNEFSFSEGVEMAYLS